MTDAPIALDLRIAEAMLAEVETLETGLGRLIAMRLAGLGPPDLHEILGDARDQLATTP